MTPPPDLIRVGEPEAPSAPARVSLCEALDRILHKGVVAKADLKISVAGVDLVYIGLGALVASVESAQAFIEPESVERPLQVTPEKP